MKVKVISNYESHAEAPHNNGICEFTLESDETHLNLDEILDAFDHLGDFENETGITIDHGGDDDYYELTLPDYCDDRPDAEQQTHKVFGRAMRLIAAYKEGV